MKSSGPVFTRQNPFQPASKPGKAHYHPSRNQPLSKRDKKTALSPERPKQRPSSRLSTPKPASQKLLEKRDLRVSKADEQPVFAESWPSSDWGSSPSSTTSSVMDTAKQSKRAGLSTVSSEPGAQQDSVLAKFVERFRHGRPQSREERQQVDPAVGEKPFWWMSPSSLPPTSTPTKSTNNDVIQPLRDDYGQHRRDGSLSPCRGSLSILSDTSQVEFDDTEILHLQEKANRLLLKEYDDQSIHVSSEGLGCSDFSSPVSVDEPMRRPFINCSIKPATEKAGLDSVQAVSYQKSTLVPPARPEEDILYQWRLRRKIEQARERPLPLQHNSPAFSWQITSLSHLPQQQIAQPSEFPQNPAHPQTAGPQPETKVANASCPPASGPPPTPPVFVVSGSSVPQPNAIAHVPAHMHLLCDVLPCPVQSSHASGQENVSQWTDKSRAKVVHKKTQVPAMNTLSDEPVCEHVQSAPPVSSRGVDGERPGHHKGSARSKKENGQTKESEKYEREKQMPVRKQKKTRSAEDREHADGHGSAKSNSSHQRVPKKASPLSEQQQRDTSQEFCNESSRSKYAPPPSPVHSALGQVVSEVLFPSGDSSPAVRTPSFSPPRASSAPPRSSVPPHDEQNSVEVISQLLQEAEDSDEKEFEDDPLLQVLRQQRTWVKEQIREVDSMLNEFQDKQQVT